MNMQRDEVIRGSNQWAWSGLTLTVVENTLDLADLDAVVQSVQPEFVQIEIRRRAAGPMAGGIHPEAALVAAFSIAAAAFLAELGKDAYRAFRAALFAAYERARTWANDRGYKPLGIEISWEEEPLNIMSSEDPTPNLFFSFEEEMKASEFERAMQALLRQYKEIERPHGVYYISLRYDAKSDGWIEEYRQ